MENFLVKINNAALKFLEPLTPIETYTRIIQEATQMMGAEYGSIILLSNGVLSRVYASRPIAYKTANRKRANTYRSFNEKRIIIATIKETGKVHPELKNEGILSTIFVPLLYQNQSIGVMTLNSKIPITLSSSDLDAMKLFGSLASLAIKKTSLYNETKTALELRDVFIGLAAHELRTPLTSIYGYAQLIDARAKKSELIDPAWSKELLRETSRMAYLTEELLVVNYLKTGKFLFNFKNESILTVLSEALSKFRLEYPNHKITEDSNVEPKDNNNPCIVKCDLQKLVQAIYNILENAGKYSTDQSVIHVKLRCMKKSLTITIEDTGKGISKEDLPYLFEGFYKGKNNYAKGLGVGLYLAKYIVEKHKGKISLQSKEGKGTRVTIHLLR